MSSICVMSEGWKLVCISERESQCCDSRLVRVGHCSQLTENFPERRAQPGHDGVRRMKNIFRDKRLRGWNLRVPVLPAGQQGSHSELNLLLNTLKENLYLPEGLKPDWQSPWSVLLSYRTRRFDWGKIMESILLILQLLQFLFFLCQFRGNYKPKKKKSYLQTGVFPSDFSSGKVWMGIRRKPQGRESSHSIEKTKQNKTLSYTLLI